MRMTVAVTRRELSAAELRREAVRCREAAAARGMLALALVLEGSSREAAARAAGMDRQTLRDWVHRYNAEGLAGLHDRPRSGRKPRLTPEQMADLEKVVEQGPDPARDGVVRWRRGEPQAGGKGPLPGGFHPRPGGAPPASRCGPSTRRASPRRRKRSKKLWSIGSGDAARARGRQTARDLV